MNYSECITRTGRRLIGLAGLLLVVGALFLPGKADAQGICDIALAAGPTSTTDTDNDGFTDWQECTGITTLGQGEGFPGRFFPWCGTANTDGIPPTRDSCMDPESKDLFAILQRAATGSLLPAVQSPGSTTPYNPFLPFTAYGINFIGLNALGVAVHLLNPLEAAVDRTVAASVASLVAPKAVKITESTELNGTILGNCQWGTPGGLDGCIIYTQRTQNFIASTCGSATIQTPSGAGPMTIQDVVWAYGTYLVLHETGHSLGGLTGEYNSRTGGYHYKPGSGLVMEQAVTYTVKSGTCKFYISPNWNVTLDPPNVRLR